MAREALRELAPAARGGGGRLHLRRAVRPRGAARGGRRRRRSRGRGPGCWSRRPCEPSDGLRRPAPRDRPGPGRPPDDHGRKPSPAALRWMVTPVGSRKSRDACRMSVFPQPRSPAPARAEAHPVRRRRAQLHREAVGRLRRPLGTDVPGRLRGRPAQPGRHDPLRGAQRARGRPRRAHLQRLAGPGGADARARGPAVHGRQPPPGEGLRRVRPRPSPPSWATPTCSPPSTSPASRWRPKDRTLDDPIVLAGGHAAFNPEPIADFIDAAVIGDGEQAVLDMTEIIRAWKAEGRPGGREEVLLPPGEDRRRLRPGVLRRRVPARRPHRPRRAQPLGRAVAGVQAHRHGPRRVALPQAAAGPARRDRPRADVGGDLPRLHPRLPLLPGGHDHPPGARAVASPASARWWRRASRRPASRRSACSRCPPPTTPRSATSPRASRTGTRRTRSASRCPPPGSTPSTSTSPTS